MSAALQQVSSVALRPGCWRVELALTPGTSRPMLDPRAFSAGPDLRVVSVVPGARSDRLVVVLSGSDARTGGPVRLSHGDWAADISLSTTIERPPSDPSRAVAARAGELDLRGRDYDALRTRLLQVVAERTDAGSDGQPVAESTAVVELMAYLGATLGYAQDAISTEAYLATARRRISVRRHAELLDYRLGEGRSARVWVRLGVSAPIVLDAGTELTGAAPGPVFATTTPVELEPERPPLRLDPEHHPDLTLPAGSTSAWLAEESSDRPLRVGLLLLLEPDNPGRAAGHVVRVTEIAGRRIGWAPGDAVPGDLARHAPLVLRVGNLVVADHGRRGAWQDLEVPYGARWWPRLDTPDPSMGVSPRHRHPATSAAEELDPAADPVAAVELREPTAVGVRSWRQRPSLLDSGPLDRDYVVEIEDDRTVRLRFGDDVNGVRPWPGTVLQARVRTADGASGALAARQLVRVRTTDPRVCSVDNPVASVGFARPESITSARIEAPQAFRRDGSATDPAGLLELTRAIPGVEDAAVAFVDTGGGRVVRVRVAGPDPAATDPGLLEDVRATLGRRMPVGLALNVAGTRIVPVEVEVEVVADRAWAIPALRAEIDRLLDATLLLPGRWRLGAGLYRSEPVALLVALAGVQDVRLTRFGWAGGRRDDPAGRDPAGREQAGWEPAALLPPFGAVIGFDGPAGARQPGFGYRITTVLP